MVTKNCEPLLFILQSRLGVSLSAAADILGPILDKEGSVEIKKARDSISRTSEDPPAPIFDSWAL